MSLSIQADFGYVLSLNLDGSVIRVRLSTPGCHVGKQATSDARSLAHRGVGVKSCQSFAGHYIQVRGVYLRFVATIQPGRNEAQLSHSTGI